MAFGQFQSALIGIPGLFWKNESVINKGKKRKLKLKKIEEKVKEDPKCGKGRESGVVLVLKRDFQSDNRRPKRAAPLCLLSVCFQSIPNL